MPIYRIADFNIELKPKYEYLPRACAAYLAEDQTAAPDVTVEIPDELIARELARDPSHTPGYLESLATCRALCALLAPRGVILFHAATVKVGEYAYAFSAPSGTGKSTHIALWRKFFGEQVQMLNGDKPFMREADGVFTVYGTPWCGKEGWNRNDSAPLGGLCFLKRGEQNAIRRMSAEEAVDRIFAQLLKPQSAAGVAETLRLADLLIRHVPIWELTCNISREAAELSFRALTSAAAATLEG